MTVYANLVNGEVKGVYDLLPETWNGIADFRNQALNNEEFMKQNQFVKIVRDTTPYDNTTHRMSDFPTYTVKNGQVIEHREIMVLPPAPTEAPTE